MMLASIYLLQRVGVERIGVIANFKSPLYVGDLQQDSKFQNGRNDFKCVLGKQYSCLQWQCDIIYRWHTHNVVLVLSFVSMLESYIQQFYWSGCGPQNSLTNGYYYDGPFKILKSKQNGTRVQTMHAISHSNRMLL